MEIKKLTITTSIAVIRALSEMFATHGIWRHFTQIMVHNFQVNSSKHLVQSGNLNMLQVVRLIHNTKIQIFKKKFDFFKVFKKYY